MTAEIDYEAEYNNRARVPEHPSLIAGWARDAQAYRESGQNLFHTISYGPGARNTIDVFPSRNQGDMVVFIHGGYWQALDGSFFSHLAARSQRARCQRGDSELRFVPAGFDR